MKSRSSKWVHRIVGSHSPDSELARRQLRINLLLLGFIGASMSAFLASVVHNQFNSGQLIAPSFYIVAGFVVCMCILFVMSRFGWHRQAAYGLLAVLMMMATGMLVLSKLELSIIGLMFILPIVLSSVIVGPRSVLWLVAIASLLLLAAKYAQVSHLLAANVSWLIRPIKSNDVTAYVAVLWIAGLATWLSAKEMEASLARAYESERSLRKRCHKLEAAALKHTDKFRGS